MTELTEARLKEMLDEYKQSTATETQDMLVSILANHSKQIQEGVDGAISGIASRLEKQTKARFDELNPKLAIIDQIGKIIEEPDEPSKLSDDSQNTSTSSTPAIPQEILNRLAELEQTNKVREERVQQLEQTLTNKEKEEEATKQRQVEASRRESALGAIRKIAPSMGLIEGLDEPLLIKLQSDNLLQVSEDGTQYMLKSIEKDRFTGNDKQVLKPLDAALPDVLKAQYTQFLVARGGVGSAAVPSRQTQFTNAQNPISEAATPEELYALKTKDPAAYKAYIQQLGS